MKPVNKLWNWITRKPDSIQPTFDVDSTPYSTNTPPPTVSDHARAVAKEIRGTCEPAIFLHGIMPRSGTVFVGNLIKLHPDLTAYPGEIWEIPFLSSTGKLIEFQDSFFATYSKNDDKLGRDDFLVIFGASFVRYLSAHAPGNRLFIKEPRVRYLNYFFTQFPCENLVLLIRDGRDVVCSTVRSWPEKSFDAVCSEWDRAARLCKSFMDSTELSNDQVIFAKFEQVVDSPSRFIESVCKKFGLDPSRYPFDQIDSIPVQGSSTRKADGRVSWDPVDRDSGFNPVGRWQNWSRDQKQTFKDIAGDSLIDMGYEDSMDW